MQVQYFGYIHYEK